MSSYSRMRKERRRRFKVFKENADYIIGDTYVFQIHEIPSEIEYEDEFSFWIIDPKDCWMLILEKSRKNEVHFQREKVSTHVCCRLKTDFEIVNIEEQLNLVKVAGIPYRMKGRFVFQLK